MVGKCGRHILFHDIYIFRELMILGVISTASVPFREVFACAGAFESY